MSFLSEYADLQLLRQDGTHVPARDALAEHAFVLVYFASHSVPACQRFTLDLAAFYKSHAHTHAFTVLFVSHDRLERYMLDFFYNRRPVYVPHTCPCDDVVGTQHPRAPHAHASSHMATSTTTLTCTCGHANWLALPFAERDVARALRRRCRVTSVPSLAVVDVATSRVLSYMAVAHVHDDPGAVHFPWADAAAAATTMTLVCTAVSTVVSASAAAVGATLRRAMRRLPRRTRNKSVTWHRPIVLIVAMCLLLVFVVWWLRGHDTAKARAATPWATRLL